MHVLRADVHDRAKILHNDMHIFNVCIVGCRMCGRHGSIGAVSVKFTNAAATYPVHIPPILALPNIVRPNMVDCEARTYAVGAVLR